VPFFRISRICSYLNIALAAQCFAVELQTTSDKTHIIIGGGYGLTARTESETGEAKLARSKARIANDEYLSAVNQSGRVYTPRAFEDVFDVHVPDFSKSSFYSRVSTGQGWEWLLYNISKTKLPRPGDLLIHAASPELSWLDNVCEGDFRADLTGAVAPDDEDTALGRLVILHGLSGRSELNGAVARCGPWLKNNDRYHVVLSHTPKRNSLAVKPSNLRYAGRLEGKMLTEAITSTALAQMRTGTVRGTWLTSPTTGCPLEAPSFHPAEKGAIEVTDNYRYVREM